MDLRLLFSVAIMIVLNTACVTHYTHDTKSRHDFDRDDVDCAAKAGSACGHGPYADSCIRSMRDRCLQGEGWVPVRW